MSWWGSSMRTRGSLLWVCALFALGCGERPLEPRGPTPGVPQYRFVTYNIAHFTSGDPTLSAVGETNGETASNRSFAPRVGKSQSVRLASGSTQ